MLLADGGHKAETRGVAYPATDQSPCWLGCRRNEPEEPVEERDEPSKHAPLLLSVPAIGREARDWRQDLRDLRAAWLDATVTEGTSHERQGLVPAQALLLDDAVEFSGAARGDVSGPLLVDDVARRDAVHKRLDEVLLVAEAGAAVNGSPDLDQDLLVLVLAPMFSVPLDEQQDVVDGDLDLLD